jgi:tRNA U34 5-carboxymethylaminomethyl modifying enzyme MnmG/GidA
MVRRSEFEFDDFRRALGGGPVLARPGRGALLTAFAERKYEPFIQRQHAEVRRLAALEHQRLPANVDYGAMGALRTEAREALKRFRPATLGQALRLEGLTPADVTLLSVLI